MNTAKLWIQLVRWFGAAFAIIGALPIGNLAAYHAWAGGFPPPERAQWHSHCSNIFFALTLFLLFVAVALLWFLRLPPPPRDRPA